MELKRPWWLALALLGGAPAAATVIAGPVPRNWHVHEDARLGLSLCYPPEFRDAGARDKDGALVLTATDGAVLRIHGGRGDAARARAMLVGRGATIDAEAAGPGWFQFSGTRQLGARGFHMREIDFASGQGGFMLDYPMAHARRWTQVAGTMSGCLRGVARQ